jgi:phospholipid-binding lipoprotein MlaA
MRSNRQRIQLLLITAFVVAMSAGPVRAQVEPHDPWEPANRKLYAFNQVLDHWIIAPAAHGYARIVPRPLRAGMHNFSRNLGEPLVFVNDLLQGHVGTAASTLGRFAINSTVGLLGVFDVAAKGRIPHHDNGFGTTLGRWGVSPGPYVFLPVAGPTNVRDSLGGVVNIFLSPQYYVNNFIPRPVGLGTLGVNGLETRLDAQQTLDTIQQTSTDPYATLRSYFMQNREATVHGATSPVELPDFDTPDMPSAPETQTGPQGAPQAQPPLPPIESEPEPSGATQTQPQASPAAPSGPAPVAPPVPAEPSSAAPSPNPEPAH